MVYFDREPVSFPQNQGSKNIGAMYLCSSRRQTAPNGSRLAPIGALEGVSANSSCPPGELVVLMSGCQS